MCQKCQIQTDENGAFSSGTRDAQAVCCFLLGLWGDERRMGGEKNRQKETEGGEKSEKRVNSSVRPEVYL